MEYNLHNTLTTQDNAMPLRSFYVPFSNTDFDLDFSKSNKVKLLTDWKFSYYPAFSQDVIDRELTDKIKTPSCWQMLGYDKNQYTNVRYPFPNDPPYIDKDIPCAVYETEYNLTNKEEKKYIVFEGVDSCFYLIVNGKYVGYSTVSHSQTEFDLTNYLKEKNTIKVIVLKWCQASYLEDQDKLRMSGIFREVYILSRPEGHFFDYKVSTEIEGKDGKICANFDKPVTVKLYDNGLLIGEKSGENIIFEIKDAKFWNAENPYLYTLIIERLGEYVQEKVGIRAVTIKNATLLINGKSVKLRGVNRHSMTVNGYVESIDDLVKDILLLKKYNINAVRTSHYPPHPLFTKLCDEYGLYVLEEADLEAHGIVCKQGNYDYHFYADIVTNPIFFEQIKHRAERMYQRDKNRSSVIIWSLGNESGFATNDGDDNGFIYAADLLHKLDDRPIHYEGNFRCLLEEGWFKDDCLDVFSRMYPVIADVEKYASNNPQRPLIICEYTHAMGNSCGDCKDYWKVIDKYDCLSGAFVWEWCNHGIKQGDKMLYGGDFGDDINDGNFCADGLIDLDRKYVHSSLLEVSQVYSPVKIWSENKKFFVKNENSFECLSGYKANYQIKQNGKEVFSKDFDINGLEAESRKQIEVDLTSKLCGYVTVDFTITNSKYGTEYVSQVVLEDEYPITSFVSSPFIFDNEKIEVVDGYTVELSSNGMIKNISRGGTKYLIGDTKFNLFRAPTDNDTRYVATWKRYFLDKLYFYKVNESVAEDKIIIDGKLVYDSMGVAAFVKLEYAFSVKGISVKVKADIADFMPPLPRFGLQFCLPCNYENVEYFGAGDREAYEDKKLYAPVGLYKNTVDGLFEHYVKPQENGSHALTRLVSLSNGKNKIAFLSKKDFSFSASHFDQSNMPLHDFELLKDDATYLNIDYRMGGVGSSSCGPNIDEKYQITEKHIEFDFYIEI